MFLLKDKPNMNITTTVLLNNIFLNIHMKVWIDFKYLFGYTIHHLMVNLISQLVNKVFFPTTADNHNCVVDCI